MDRRASRFVLVLAISLLSRPGLAFAEDAWRSARSILEEARAGTAKDGAAVARLLEPASPRRVAELRLLLADADPYFRRTAARGLSLLGDRPVTALARLLKDEDRGVQEAAEEALAAAGAPAVAPMGEILAVESCVSPSFKAAVRILGRIGDPAGIPYLADVLVRYRTGGLQQRIGMQALQQIGGPAAVAQLMQLTDYRELGEEAFLALMAVERDGLLRTVGILLDDAAEDPMLRLFYAMQLNEVAGTAGAAPVLLRFFGSLAVDPALAPEIRNKGAALRNLFEKAEAGANFYRKPLTRQRLNAMYAARKEDEESPFIDARREQEAEMDKIRAERRALERPWPIFLHHVKP